MRETIKKQYIFDAVSLLTATFTAAVTNIVTSNSHGLSNGDALLLTTTDTLPAGLSANTIYYVCFVTTNTFKLSVDKPDSNGIISVVDITDTGTGTHTFTVCKTGQPILVADFVHKGLTLATAGMGAGDTITVKVQKSSSETAPNFHLTKSATNDWDYCQIVDSEDGSTVDGDTGVTFSDANDLRNFAINDDDAVWINLEITAQSDVANTSLTGFINLAN